MAHALSVLLVRVCHGAKGIPCAKQRYFQADLPGSGLTPDRQPKIHVKDLLVFQK